MVLYGLSLQNIDLIGLVSSFLAVIDPNSFGLVMYVHCPWIVCIFLRVSLSCQQMTSISWASRRPHLYIQCVLEIIAFKPSTMFQNLLTYMTSIKNGANDTQWSEKFLNVDSKVTFFMFS